MYDESLGRDETPFLSQRFTHTWYCNNLIFDIIENAL